MVVFVDLAKQIDDVIAAQNYDFTKKKEVYFKEKSTPFRITQWLEQKDKWTALDSMSIGVRGILAVAEGVDA